MMIEPDKRATAKDLLLHSEFLKNEVNKHGSKGSEDKKGEPSFSSLGSQKSVSPDTTSKESSQPLPTSSSVSRSRSSSKSSVSQKTVINNLK
jgi:hypothetical protein